MTDKTYEQAKAETNEKYKDVIYALRVAAQAQDVPFSDFLDQVKADIESGCTVKINVDLEKLQHYSVEEPRQNEK